MKIDVLTLFPEMFECIKSSIIKRAINESIINLDITNIRDFSKEKHKKCDDIPYGGGPGMVLTPQPLYDVIMSKRLNFQSKKNQHKIESKTNENLKNANTSNTLKNKKDCDKIQINDYAKTQIVVYMSPKGELFSQKTALELAKFKHMIIVCGHYEGIDQRVIELCVDKEISIGDYILTGGEIPAMAVIDSVTRLLPNVIKKESLTEESFSNKLLEYPQYTRPQTFKNLTVPEILLSGNHEKIKIWRQNQSLKMTKERRHDMYKKFIQKNKK